MCCVLTGSANRIIQELRDGKIILLSSSFLLFSFFMKYTCMYRPRRGIHIKRLCNFFKVIVCYCKVYSEKSCVSSCFSGKNHMGNAFKREVMIFW